MANSAKDAERAASIADCQAFEKEIKDKLAAKLAKIDRGEGSSTGPGTIEGSKSNTVSTGEVNSNPSNNDANQNTAETVPSGVTIEQRDDGIVITDNRGGVNNIITIRSEDHVDRISNRPEDDSEESITDSYQPQLESSKLDVTDPFYGMTEQEKREYVNDVFREPVEGLVNDDNKPGVVLTEASDDESNSQVRKDNNKPGKEEVDKKLIY